MGSLPRDSLIILVFFDQKHGTRRLHAAD